MKNQLQINLRKRLKEVGEPDWQALYKAWGKTNRLETAADFINLNTHYFKKHAPDCRDRIRKWILIYLELEECLTSNRAKAKISVATDTKIRGRRKGSADKTPRKLHTNNVLLTVRYLGKDVPKQKLFHNKLYFVTKLDRHGDYKLSFMPTACIFGFHKDWFEIVKGYNDGA